VTGHGAARGWRLLAAALRLQLLSSMSKKKRPKSDDNSSDAQNEKKTAAGKKTRSGHVKARNPQDEAASTDLPGAASGSSSEVGPEDFEVHAPVKLHIIDMAVREEGTQIAVARGTNQGVTMLDHASVTDRNGKVIAPAKIVSVGPGTTFLMTPLGMDQLEKAVVQLD
jgi:hypothetical protein